MSAEQTTLNPEEFVEVVSELLQKGGTLQSFAGLDDEALEAIYGVAFNLYNNGQYDKSEKMFQFLSIQDHLERKYFMGLGACRQMKQEYEQAVSAYSYAALLDMKDPLAPLHCGECHMAMRNRDKAISGFKAAMDRAANGSYDETIHARAADLLSLAETTGGQPCQ